MCVKERDMGKEDLPTEGYYSIKKKERKKWVGYLGKKCSLRLTILPHGKWSGSVLTHTQNDSESNLYLFSLVRKPIRNIVGKHIFLGSPNLNVEYFEILFKDLEVLNKQNGKSHIFNYYNYNVNKAEFQHTREGICIHIYFHDIWENDRIWGKYSHMA